MWFTFAVPDGVDQGMAAYEKLGFAGLFVFIFLVSFFMSFIDRRRTERQYTALVERTSTAIESSNASQEAETRALDSLKVSVDRAAQQEAEFLSYLRGRDSMGGKS
jgi:hypothetical protein